MLIVGEEEEKNGTISIRRHGQRKETSALRLNLLK
jgi:threonyl-tRNA synthetase